MVTDRKADATATIARLADLLRVSLETPERGSITLASELEIVRAYAAIERVRFADRLHIVIDADAATLDATVPAMILQPLVENAVRHAVAVRDEPTTIRLSSRAGGPRQRADRRGIGAIHPVLTVSDDGPGTGESGGFGVGLANIAARLDELYPGVHRFVVGPTPDGGYRAEISLPLSRDPVLALARDLLEVQLDANGFPAESLVPSP